jgi:hypothetical protein
MNIEEIKSQALKEIKEEDFRKAVEKYKQKLRNKKPVWYKLFPYKIILIRR